MKKRTKGFTLVEIMIVVAIIGLLIAIALPNFMKARRKSVIRTAQASLKQIEGAREQYLIDAGTNANNIDAIEAAVVPDYIKVWPKCPSGGEWEWDTTNITATIDGYFGDVAFSAYDTVNP